MQLYKKFPIDNLSAVQQELKVIADELFTTQETTSCGVTGEWLMHRSPLIREIMEKNNFQLEVGRFLQTAPYGNLPIHIDGSEEYPKYIALNIPVYGCDNSEMRWWSNVELTNVTSSEAYGSGAREFDSPNKVCLARLVVTEPHWMRVNIPHDVENPKDTLRMMLSMRFRPDPEVDWD